MKAVVIGSGNVAYHLAEQLVKAKHDLVQVAGRNKRTVKALAKKYGVAGVADLTKVDTSSDVIIIAVNDDSIREVVQALPFSDKIVLHTSGSVSLNIISSKFKNAGVFYPLQSLHKNKVSSNHKITWCVEATSTKVLSILTKLAASMNGTAVKLNSEQRLHLHLAAVVVNNFVNHLFTLSADFLQKNNVPFSLLTPLIAATAEKIKMASPSTLQTGPAIRKDKKTMNRHLELLKKDPHLRKMYKEFSLSISTYYNR